VDLCLKYGAFVVASDINPPVDDFEETDKFKFVKADVASWESLRDAFVQAEKWFGRIDHVFANAGVATTTFFLEGELDANGELAPPNMRTININLIGVLHTVHLAAHYIQKHATHRAEGELGSIVVTASTSSFQNFSAGDYTITKHGILGIIRGLGYQIEGKVRLNAVAPSWTATGMIPSEFIESLGVGVQAPEVVAKSVALLFTDQKRHAEVIYSWDGKYQEVNKAKGGLLDASDELLENACNEETVMRQLQQMIKERQGLA
jgi:NAD(P)-dependent dehydrogenase (short-subunit alcohol dehydrogenase family)